jgi:hypothetical protein
MDRQDFVVNHFKHNNIIKEDKKMGTFFGVTASISMVTWFFILIVNIKTFNGGMNHD